MSSGVQAKRSLDSADAQWVEWYLGRHTELVAFECEQRGARAVALELSRVLVIPYAIVMSAMRERMFVVPAALDALESA